MWSKHTLHRHIKQDLANACAKLTIQVNADPFLETVPPSEHTGYEDMSEDKCFDKELTLLSTASCTPEFFENTAESRLPYTCRLETEYRAPPNLALVSKPESRHLSRLHLNPLTFLEY